MKNKKILSEVIKDLLSLIKKSEFYNKVQIIYNFQGKSHETETFYFFENIWGHSIFKETEGSSDVETIQATEEIQGDEKLIARLGELESDAQVNIASNSREFILSIKI